MAGFDWVGTESQGDPTGNTRLYSVSAGHIGVLGPGDMVVITGDSDAEGIPEVDNGNNSIANTGVIMSVLANVSGGTISHIPTFMEGKVLVNVDSQALYRADVRAGFFTVSDIGKNAKIITDVGTITSGFFTSNMTLDNLGAITNPIFPVRLVALLEGSDGVLGSRALVRINETTSKSGALGIN